MNKSETLSQSFIDIDTATEISHATLTELMENSDDSRIQYIILGVLEQLEKIKKSTQFIDKAMEGGSGMRYKELIIKMILEMDNELYLIRAYHYILAKYNRRKGGAA